MPPASNQHSTSIGSDDTHPNLALQWINVQYQVLQRLELPESSELSSLFSDQSEHGPHLRRQHNNDFDSDTVVPHPPPPYTPTVALHAPTLLPNMVDPSVPTNHPGTGTIANSPSSPINPRAVLGAVLLSSILAILAASATFLYLNKKQMTLRDAVLAIFRRVTAASRNKRAKMKVLKLTNTSEEDLVHPSGTPYRTSAVLDYYNYKREEIDDQWTCPETTRTHRELPAHLDLADLGTRRYSSPAQINVDIASGTFSPDPALPRPTSLPPPGREISMYIQQQKAAERAQIIRMKVVRDESFASKAPSLPLSTRQDKQKRISVSHGLGLIHDRDGIDIASTLLSSLHGYSFSASQTAPTVPVTDLLKVSETGKVVYPRMPKSRSDPESLGSSASEVSMAETDIVDGGIVEFRMAHTRSMEMKRGVLVSLGPSTTDVPQLLVSTPSSHNNICATSFSRTSSLNMSSVDNTYLRPDSPTAMDYEMADFPSPPPMLSPILPSSFALSAEIQKSLEDRVFSYRDSGPWSKDGYRLSTPGQIRALMDALELSKSRVDERDRASWTWRDPVLRASE